LADLEVGPNSRAGARRLDRLVPEEAKRETPLKRAKRLYRRLRNPISCAILRELTPFERLSSYVSPWNSAQNLTAAHDPLNLPCFAAVVSGKDLCFKQVSQFALSSRTIEPNQDAKLTWPTDTGNVPSSAVPSMPPCGVRLILLMDQWSLEPAAGASLALMAENPPPPPLLAKWGASAPRSLYSTPRSSG